MAKKEGHHAPDAERMQELLRYANYAKVADELGVHRATVARWAAGESVPAWAVKAVERLILGTEKEAAAPEWARRLYEGLVAEIQKNRDEIMRRTSDDLAGLRERMDDALAGIEQPQQQHGGGRASSGRSLSAEQGGRRPRQR